MSRLAIALLSIACISTPWIVHAEDVAPTPQEVVVSAEDFAKLIGAYGQVKALKDENAALEQSLTNMTEQRDRAVELAKVRAEQRDAYKELAAIKAEVAEAAKQRLADVEASKRAAVFWPKVRERCVEGAVIGSLAGSAVPGVGNVAGAFAGCIIGGVIGAAEAWTQGP